MNLTEILVEKAMSSDDLSRYVDAVHASVDLPDFDDLLFIRLYQNATPETRLAVARILRQPEQLSAFQDLNCETA